MTSLRRAFIKSLPIAYGYIPLGMISGMLLTDGGLTPLEVVMMSVLVFAGSSQFVAAGMFQAAMSGHSIIFATFIINLRQMLYSSSLSRYVKEKNPCKLIILSHFITDETYAVNRRAYQVDEWTDQLATLTGLISNIYWLVGNLSGALFGRFLAIPLDVSLFALTALFIILLIFQIETRRQRRMWLVSSLVAVLVYSVNQSGVSIIISTVISVAIGLLTEREEVADEPL